MKKSNKRTYDKLKTRLYRAEDLFEESTGYGQKFETLTEVGEYVTKISRLDSSIRRVGYIGIKLAHGNAVDHWADFEENLIYLLSDQMTEQIVLHEIAHLIAGKEKAFHGHDFCWIYLDLTLRWRGRKAYTDLRNKMREVGIFP